MENGAELVALISIGIFITLLIVCVVITWWGNIMIMGIQRVRRNNGFKKCGEYYQLSDDTWKELTKAGKNSDDKS